MSTQADYSADITAWATVALVLATVALAYLTWILAKATSRASVVVTIEPNPAAIQFLDIHIINEGNAAAYDVQIRFDPELPASGGQFSAIKVPSRIAMFVAGQRIISSLCEAFVILDNSYEITVSWKVSPRSWRRQAITYAFDLSHMNNLSRLGNDPAIQSADELKKIRETLDKMITGFSRLKVDVHSQEDRDRERDQRHAEIEQRRVANKPVVQKGPPPARPMGRFSRFLSLLRRG